MIQRRQFLQLSGLGLASSPLSASISQYGQRPQLPGSINSGDVNHDSAVIWSRTDRPAMMWVTISTEPDFKNSQRFPGTAALAETDFNAKAVVHGLRAGTRYFYRVQFESLDKPGLFGELQQGQFKTAQTQAGTIRFCWSGDTAGQGYGIDTSRGGMHCYAEMLKRQPDFLVHCGDLIYADGPIQARKTLSDGTVWNNIVTPGKSKVAETLQEFRENYYYNFLDPKFKQFHQNVSSYQQWDDHEVVNNWYPGEQLLDDKRYTIKSVSLLAERARQALLQCNPIRLNPEDPRRIYRKVSHGPMLDIFFLDMRSYRAANSLNRQKIESAETAFLGREQLAWLQNSLASSTATWKIIASDMPIGLRVTEWQSEVAENAANGNGPALGRELEIARLLQFIAEKNVHNVHFITADVHYCASHYYHPRKAQFKDFKPFWEFVSGPLHAGTFGPNELDNTFGPELIFKGIPDDLSPNAPPSDNHQFFGEIEIDGLADTLTVKHFNRLGEELWRKTLKAEA
ncbi:alkaline phosphatase D family protein [Pseudoteredinibacter isoporae]|uniref:Alkaline phosphatase D n=1 Tax=Pseudoteredinibacter isoporae TaxID=570281 RepID=A0A7X0JRS1_9GAMM|nr:alkaline phosphatase D family protein [Pseudoteredinibacter isoporae]MBB6520589.1 alkaline phosphatase D [Pseudoteredinibacter isoporae]NHO86156.1 alkaline phosphatase [Pseudoteredinibacter isoporae]NIB25393.1 alkaline phosphatase [Pseudoteredinibacter isoporae]